MKETVSILVRLGALTLMFGLNMRHAFNEYGLLCISMRRYKRWINNLYWGVWTFCSFNQKVSVSTDTFI